jgi:hypothetical protein
VFSHFLLLLLLNIIEIVSLNPDAALRQQGRCVRIISFNRPFQMLAFGKERFCIFKRYYFTVMCIYQGVRVFLNNVFRRFGQFLPKTL